MASPTPDRPTNDARHAGRVARETTRLLVLGSLLSALLTGSITIAGQRFLAPVTTKPCISMVELEAADRLHDQHKLDTATFERVYRQATHADC